MKTIIISSIFLLSATGLLAVGQPSGFLDDSNMIMLEDEAYVNDIPFDTWKISRLSNPPDFVQLLPEEGYVDDIPFNTVEIAQEILLSKVTGQGDEPSVNDIPFNTEKIFTEMMMREWTARWQDEGYVDDIPFNTCEITGVFTCTRGYRFPNSEDFKIRMEQYLEQLNDKMKDLETLSFEYPF